MRKKSIEELTSPENLKIDPRYDLYTKDMEELKNLTEVAEMVVYAFKYGYLQGSKAAKKKKKKKEGD